MTQWLRENRIAWPTAIGEFGPKRWSCAHRVFENGVTYCSRKIPDDAVLVNQWGKPSAGKCSRCERMSARSAKYKRVIPADTRPWSLRND